MMEPGLATWRRQTWALLWADFRPFTKNSGVALGALVLLLVLLLWVPLALMATLQAQLPARLLGQVGAVFSALFSIVPLATYQGARLFSRTRDLLASLPVHTRVPWSLFFFRGAVWVAIVDSLGAAITASTPNGGGATAGAVIFAVFGLGFAGITLCAWVGRALSVVSAGAPLPVRWTIWALLTAPALGFAIGLLVTGDLGTASRLAGPYGLLSERVVAAGQSGPVALIAGAWATFLLGMAIAHAPLPARAFRPGEETRQEGVIQPFPEDDSVAPTAPVVNLPSKSATDLEAMRAQAATQWETYRARSASRGAESEFEPFALPEGPEAALRFFGKPKVVRNNWPAIAALGLLLTLVVVFLVVESSLGIRFRPGPGAFVPVTGGLWLVIVVLVSFAHAPSNATAREKRRKEAQRKGTLIEEKQEPPKPAAERTRASPRFMRRWPLLQTFPADRMQVARAFLPGLKDFAAIAAGASVIVAIAAVAFHLEAATLIWLIWGGFAVSSLLTAAALSSLGSAAVPRGFAKWRQLLRVGGSAAWGVGGFAAFLGSALLVMQVALGRPITGWLVLLVAAPAAAGAAGPYIYWRAAVERLVTSQRPYESDLRLIAVCGCGALLTVFGILAILAF